MAQLREVNSDNKSWPPGTHFLRYHYLFLSEPGPHLPQFLVRGCVNHQNFIQFDSHVGKAEPQVPWMAHVDAQYWETETQKLRAWAKLQQGEMRTLMSYYNQSSGTHTIQLMLGCEVQEGSGSRGFWKFGYDGQDHLMLELETLSWVSSHLMSRKTKHRWETERHYASYYKAYLGSLCLSSLHRYLELGGHSLTHREQPTVQVTRHSAKDVGTTLRCYAWSFYPREISVSWWLGEKELSQETKRLETRPSGDGTYQTWAVVRVPPGKETQYRCRVQHSGLSQALTVAWESPSLREVDAIILIVGLEISLGIGVVLLTMWCFRGSVLRTCDPTVRGVHQPWTWIWTWTGPGAGQGR
ncbi:H-2 class I histocompatibility antigen, Q10 alpha chain-like isoform X1 [Erinaceus europaeus]|uniref:H-2 class I histocompatibility antigen, Q10 alpha chain-like isoform X1 n=1 Tax=Erinaceus europaeus TaxID=9365 RepID=A0ABM3XX42_ERIEU|nr:H-2 class I histocompatibility antigen, Q10 alpha chain-like isoform X1 [Erinaceus europaeus]XP_060053376.1 H-2 class I histocompatibility antigen, Q10 alpha chain-like isoform X1 [Erinaceus europaeus]